MNQIAVVDMIAEIESVIGRDATLMFMCKYGGRVIHVPSLKSREGPRDLSIKLMRWHAQGYSPQQIASYLKLKTDTVVDLLEVLLTR